MAGRCWTMAGLACVMLCSTSAAAQSRFCKHGGKQYSIHSTRCAKGVHLRCVAPRTWKPIGKCKPRPAPIGPRFCKHGGKQYSIHSTRCAKGVHLRCVAPQTWKPIGKCKR